MELIDVSRKSFKAKAVRITEENMAEVAEWCGGFVTETHLGITTGEVRYIDLPKRSGGIATERRTAFAGSWVLQSGERFTVYRHASFMGTFDQTPRYDLVMAYKSGQILGAVVKALDKQNCEPGPIGERAHLLTDEIMKIFGGEK